ncbi:rubredoxin [Argonema galeatum]|uniref:rubredoxin n=1 Tax=Argonema galeatum TaxID=2942762 RepID=UPI002013BDDC|nr:rubredoxin [Argonema galeatum]MCL1463595.1 rubredoxin [Argonema galeatum A003/A1]
MQEYVCTACGYIYKPGQGDPEGSIPAGTPFSDISAEDWECPVCGAKKVDFEAYDEPTDE